MHTSLTKIALLAFLIMTGLSLTASCEKDEDLAQRELLIYVAACPTSQAQCQSNCASIADTDQNGVVEGIEGQLYSVCVADCGYACTQAFWYYLLNDE